MRPDIITKGGDYESWSVVGGDLAKVIIIPTVEGFSTTGMIERISND